MMHLALWVLGNRLLKKGILLSWKSMGIGKTYKLALWMQDVGKAMINCTGWRIDIDYVNGVDMGGMGPIG